MSIQATVYVFRRQDEKLNWNGGRRRQVGGDRPDFMVGTGWQGPSRGPGICMLFCGIKRTKIGGDPVPIAGCAPKVGTFAMNPFQLDPWGS